jgi:hypothetical protein
MTASNSFDTAELFKQRDEIRALDENIKARTNLLLNQPNKMQDFYLGSVLDGIRWGSQTTIMFEMNPLELHEFIGAWYFQNKKSVAELFAQEHAGWEKPLKLPIIDIFAKTEPTCDCEYSHGITREQTLEDRAGNLRCSKLKGGEACYEIVQENKINPIPFPTLLKRLNIESRPEIYKDNVIVPMDGFAVSRYVFEWSKQYPEGKNTFDLAYEGLRNQ